MSSRDLIETDNASFLHDPDRETELLVGIAQRVLDQARAGGAEQAEVALGSSLGREASVRLGEIETLEEARDRSVQVTVYVRQCSGSASTGDLRPTPLTRRSSAPWPLPAIHSPTARPAWQTAA